MRGLGTVSESSLGKESLLLLAIRMRVWMV